jgi:hypothetical protein
MIEGVGKKHVHKLKRTVVFIDERKLRAPPKGSRSGALMHLDHEIGHLYPTNEMDWFNSLWASNDATPFSCSN